MIYAMTIMAGKAGSARDGATWLSATTRQTRSARAGPQTAPLPLRRSPTCPSRPSARVSGGRLQGRRGARWPLSPAGERAATPQGQARGSARCPVPARRTCVLQLTRPSSHAHAAHTAHTACNGEVPHANPQAPVGLRVRRTCVLNRGDAAERPHEPVRQRDAPPPRSS
jgi:hypothetical protein